IAKGVSVAGAVNNEEKPKRVETEKKEAPKVEKKPQKSSAGESNTAVEKIKEKWPEIMSKIALGGGLNLYMALENSSLRSFGDKVAFVFPDNVGGVLRDMIEGGLGEIKEIILAETGLDVELTVKMESAFDTSGTTSAANDPFDEIAGLPWVNN
ncbi:MAG: hypothetical protein IJ297_08390, partial [Clostridia bacterium]|nr:hypothetical protein [Clostridia bacterium]